MKLTDLISHLDAKVIRGTSDKNVEALIYFSDKAAAGSVFFAIAGAEADGLCFAGEAVKRGAHTIVMEEAGGENLPEILRELPPQVTVLAVSDVRKALAEASCLFYGFPCEKLLTVAVTGTKGKTSTAYMMRAILEEAGIKTGLIGTVENGWEGSFQEADRTTPQSLDVQRWCRAMVDAGCGALVMEVSSQAMMHRRVDGIIFDAGIFTNLSPDHIGPGEHGSFEEYAGWKRSLVKRCRTAVINEDDPHWSRMKMQWTGELEPDLPRRMVSFGQSRNADYRYDQIMLIRNSGGLGVSFQMENKVIKLKLPGRFNGANAAGAAAAGRMLGISMDTVEEALKKVCVPGRVEPVDTGGKTNVLVDYAHNGVALKSLLEDLRTYEPDCLITVFGCGGNRDRNRRFEMGRAAAWLSDLIIVTSDNPRKERPEAIIKDITDAIEEAAGKGAVCTWLVEPDREKAIRLAVAEGTEDDIVLIAGKGHETWQYAGDQKIHFDDREVVRKIYGGTEP